MTCYNWIKTMDHTEKEFKNMRVTVMGLGKFGGGIGVARFLAESGAQLTVTDLKSEDDLSESLLKISGFGIRFVLGRHEIKDFTDAHMVVVSPAVPRDSVFITEARKSGTNICTEIGLFVERCSATICGITGSNGKTTTVSMIQSILECSGRTHWIGGNIGGSLLSQLNRISNDDIVVLELSSFQLEWLNEMHWSPHIAAILNVLPNHLDRHKTFEQYKDAKAAILDYQKSGNIAVLVHDDPGSRSMISHVRGRIIWVGTDLGMEGITLNEGIISERSWTTMTYILSTHNLQVPGKHTVLNAMVAAACARCMEIDSYSIARGLAAFRGLPHRLEPVGEYNGIAFCNDSKATTPEAASAGIRAFERPVIPILGGYDKKVSFDEMAKQITERVRWAALIGDTAPLLKKSLENSGIESTIYSSLEEAFKACVSRAVEGDIILLSPACASYDMFNDFEERGDMFKQLVREYTGVRT